MENTALPVGTSFDFPGDWQTPAGRFTIATIHENPLQYDCVDDRGIIWPGFHASVVERAAT